VINADLYRYPVGRKRFYAAGGHFSREEEVLSTILTFLVFIPLIWYATVFWIKAARWFYHHGQETRARVMRLRDAAVSAWQDGEFPGDASN
jgi:hypothetical protein